jgi:ribosomal protein S27E
MMSASSIKNQGLCPKCEKETTQYSHPFGKIWCESCGFVLREENEGRPKVSAKAEAIAEKSREDYSAYKPEENHYGRNTQARIIASAVVVEQALLDEMYEAVERLCTTCGKCQNKNCSLVKAVLNQ